MTHLVGTLKDSANALLSGILRVTLDASVTDTTTVPDTVWLPEPKEFVIANGEIGLNLAQTETEAVTYHFEFFVEDPKVTFYLPDGEVYEGVSHFHTDNQYYTGYIQTDDSQLIARVASTERRRVIDFHAIVPNAASVEFSQLQSTGIANDLLDTSIRRLAQLLTSNSLFAAILRGGPNPKGAYSATTYYRQDDWVSYDGASYVYKHEVPANSIEPTAATHWQLVAAKGDPGTGTSGNNQPYNPSGWLNQLDAPSRNAVRNVIEGLASKQALDLKANTTSPHLGGLPLTPLPPPADHSLQIAPTQWVNSQFARLGGAEFSGVVSVPTVSQSSSSTAAANTAWVNGRVNGLAPLNSPFFSGVPTAPPPPPESANNTLATTAFAHPRGGSAALPLSASQLVVSGGTPLNTFEEETLQPALTLANLMEATFTYSLRYGKVLRLGRCIFYTACVRTSKFTKSNGSGQVYIDTGFLSPLSTSFRVPITLVSGGSLPANTIATFGVWLPGLQLIEVECGLATAKVARLDATHLSATVNEFFIQVMLPNFS